MTKILRPLLTCLCAIATLAQVASSKSTYVDRSVHQERSCSKSYVVAGGRLNAKFTAKSSCKTSEEILQWIPDTTENLIVVNPPITYYRENSQPIDPESMSESMILGHILSSPFGVYTDDVRRVTPSAIVQTAFLDLRKVTKEFKYCEIALLKPDHVRDKKMLDAMREHAKSQTEYLGIPIFKLVSKRCDEEEEDVEYEAVPAPGVLICSSSIEYLSQILQHNKLATTIRKTGPEWNELVPSSSYWGFRRFNDADKVMYGDRDAVGYNFSYDKRTLGFKLKLFTKSTSIKDQYLKQTLEEGASVSSSEKLRGWFGLRVFRYFYPATQPTGWHGPINQKIWILTLGLPESLAMLKSESAKRELKTGTKSNSK